MENIYELANILRKFQDTLATLIPTKESSQLKKLTQIAFSKVKLTDEQCMIKIYGDRNVKAFSNLKTRLYDKLTSVLILKQEILENNEEATAQQNENIKKIVGSFILIAQGHKLIGLEMLEKSIVFARNKNFTENVLICSRKLISGYGSDRYNKYKYNKYLNIQNDYIEIYRWELKAQNYFLELQNYKINSTTNISSEFINKSIKYISELDSIKNISSPIFHYNKYRIKAIHFENIKDYNNLLIISNQAIKDLAIPKYNLPLSMSNIYIRIILSLIHLNLLDESIKYGEKIISKINAGTNSWFRLHYYLVKSYIYNRDYTKAFKLLAYIYMKPSTLKIYPNLNEIFNTILGYMHLLVKSKYLEIPSSRKENLPDFKLGKYLNSVPIYSKDKYGINVSILLMQVAFLLIKKDYNTIIDRIDSLKQYAYRYLRRDDSFRSNCMIKMVVQMTKADFHPVRTERYTADLLKQLKSVNLAGSGENIEIEVLPFEVLWDIMLKSLKD